MKTDSAWQNHHFIETFRRNWILLGIIVAVAATLADSTETVAEAGKWLKAHRGADAVIFFIFWVSGYILDLERIREGMRDVKSIALALLLVFVVSPLIVLPFGMLPVSNGIRIGIFLVAVLPPTMASAVVMTDAAGGNMAQALFITVIANCISVITIPATLPLILGSFIADAIVVDRFLIINKIAFCVLFPLFLGLLSKRIRGAAVSVKTRRKFQVVNQALVVAVIWMAVSLSRPVLLSGGAATLTAAGVVIVFHGLLLIAAVFVVKLFKLGRGTRESVIFMGGQKNLTLSVLLQVSLFPEYGRALVVCVAHHFIHLIMDGVVVGHLSSINRKTPEKS